MNRFLAASMGWAMVSACLFVSPYAQADASHFWQVVSPDHEQTWAYGSEQNRVWAE